MVNGMAIRQVPLELLKGEIVRAAYPNMFYFASTDDHVSGRP